MTLKNKLFITGAVALGIGVAGLGVSCAQYADYAGFSEKTQTGRTKNALAVLVSGIAAQQAYGNGSYDLTAHKFYYPDASIHGNISEQSIDSRMELLLTDSYFSATRSDSNDIWQGTVEKSEFDWDVRQVRSNQFTVGRFGLKWNGTLILNASGGVIEGEYIPGNQLSFNITIQGTYDKAGNMSFAMDSKNPLYWGITVDGVVNKQIPAHTASR